MTNREKLIALIYYAKGLAKIDFDVIVGDNLIIIWDDYNKDKPSSWERLRVEQVLEKANIYIQTNYKTKLTDLGLEINSKDVI